MDKVSLYKIWVKQGKNRYKIWIKGHGRHFTLVASMRSSSTINQRTDSCTDSSFFRLQLTVAEVYIEGGQGGQSTSGNWQLTLFKPWGADYARHSTASPPRFKMLSTPLSSFIAGNFRQKIGGLRDPTP